MPSKNRPLKTSQLPGYYKAVKIADIIVRENAELLKTLYNDTEHPKTFASIGEQVWPSSENEISKTKFVKGVIYIALKQIFNETEFERIRKIRIKYFGSQLFDTIKTNHGQKKVDAIHFLAGKSTWKNNGPALSKIFKSRAAEQGFAPWYTKEIDFLDKLIQNTDFHYPNGYLNNKKISSSLNRKFHRGQSIRTAKSVDGFLYKRARSWWSDDEFALLQTLLTSNISQDFDAIADQLNKAYHDGAPVRTASCIPFIVAKKRKEAEKIKSLGLDKGK